MEWPTAARGCIHDGRALSLHVSSRLVSPIMCPPSLFFVPLPYPCRFPSSSSVRIWNASVGGSALWDSGVRTVAVSGGVFSVLLGESPQPPLLLPFDQDYWLEVTFNDVVQSPRQRFASVWYAYMASKASGLVPGITVSGSCRARRWPSRTPRRWEAPLACAG